MKTLTLIILLLLIIPQSKGQDVMNPYILDAPIYYPYPSYPLINDLTIFPPSWATQNDPSFKWAHTGPSTGFSGEYEISLIRHPWNSFINIGGGAGLHVSYGMEIVSFPFTIDCAFTPPDECSSLSGTTDRFLYMPSAQYDTNNEAWGDLSNKFYQPIFLNNKDQSLVSRAFVKHVPMSLTTNGKVLPHTIIKGKQERKEWFYERMSGHCSGRWVAVGMDLRSRKSKAVRRQR